MLVSLAAMLIGYDFELPLRDALDDPGLDPVRRALAVRAMGTGLDTGYYAAAELLEAARLLAADRAAGIPDEQARGAARLREVLAGSCGYQQVLWYGVARGGLRAVAEHLAWLAGLMRARAGMFAAIRNAGAAMPLLPGVGDAGARD